MEWIAPMIAMLGLFTMITMIFVGRFMNQRREAEARLRADVQNKLLDRFGSSKEFVDFLQTDGGQKFLAPVAQTGGGPREKIIGAIKVGIVILSLGAGFAASSLAIGENGMMVPALLLVMLGLGFVISGIVSWRLARALGLVEAGTGKE